MLFTIISYVAVFFLGGYFQPGIGHEGEGTNKKWYFYYSKGRGSRNKKQIWPFS